MNGRRNFDIFFLVTVVLIGAWLRLSGIGVPSLWLDEILHYDIASQTASQPLWRWFGISEIENGPLFYGSELGGRLFKSVETSARIAPALFGIAAIAVGWLAAHAIGTNPTTPYVFSILLATSPLAVYYSREARPYALVLLLTAAFLAALLRGPAIKFPVVSALLILSIYSTAVMGPVVISVAIAAFLAAMGGHRLFWLSVASMAAASSIVIALAYRPSQNVAGDLFPSLNVFFFRSLFESFSIVALDSTRLHRSVFAFLMLALIGTIDLTRRQRTQGLLVIAMTLFPLLIGIAGVRLMHHFFSVRYVISALPGYLLLVSIGVASIVRWIQRQKIAAAIAIGIAVLLAAQGWDAARKEPYRKLNWRAIAHAIASHAHENDVVIAANQWSAVCLGFYLRGVSPHIRLVDAAESAVTGEASMRGNSTSWIVSANASAAFNDWSCRFPVVLASPLENFRLNYFPNLYRFLTDRSAVAEQRAIRASFGRAGPVLHFDSGEDAFFGEGWSEAEPEEGRYARWAIGRTARVALPLAAPRDRTVTVEVVPVLYKGAPSQRISIEVNNQALGAATLRDDRSRYTFIAPRFFWRAGVNELAFKFDRATAPANLDPHSSDHRPLAARFFEISLRGPTEPLTSAHFIRLATPGARLEATDHDRPLPERVDTARLAQFVGRLGFDPLHVTIDLRNRRVTLADLAAASLADDSVCLADEQFLSDVFRALLGREITARERVAFGQRLKRGTPRAKIVRDLVNSGEIRRQISALGAHVD